MGISSSEGMWGCNIGGVNFDLVMLPHEPKENQNSTLDKVVKGAWLREALLKVGLQF